jgi:hypothetical protein
MGPIGVTMALFQSGAFENALVCAAFNAKDRELAIGPRPAVVGTMGV